MNTLRSQAFAQLHSKQPLKEEFGSEKISDFFGKHVFNKEAMLSFLPDEAYKGLNNAMQHGKKIDRKIADQVASAMKNWAMTFGVTHYTHWFQPLTGTTAEKHDAFFAPTANNRVIEKFEGTLLVQQEPDASSFPNGGIRNTFEARGYTAWDPTSPAFIMGKTLCIPTVFVAYTGEALDNKTPLLRALHAVDTAATAVCQYFDKSTKKVTATLGWEQEYFLVDTALYNARPDLMMTGRTLLGQQPAKGQQLDDHYFGSIPERVLAFMREFENTSLRLGIPVTTRHNEVAPNQFECAPVFGEANLSNDQNLLLMDIMRKVAQKHQFRVLMHEKPFAGVNGSGKHNNWSLSTDSGINLLKPGKNPKSNLRFLTFLVNTIAAVHDNADLLRACIATAGNAHRLGANEAPPAIISLFIGSELNRTLDAIETKVKNGKLSPEDKTDLKLNVVGKIPEILLDNTDRNRTSPFAFTGNKFEFRAVGSSSSCALPMTILNTIVAEQLSHFKEEVDARIAKGSASDDAIFQVLQKLIKSSKAIRFEGDGYSDEWVTEALSRGLNNTVDVPNALDYLVTQKAENLFSKHSVLSKVELHARHDVFNEQYKEAIQIESRVLSDMVMSGIIPSVLKYQSLLLSNAVHTKTVLGEKSLPESDYTIRGIKLIQESVNTLNSLVNTMNDERKACNAETDAPAMAKAYNTRVAPYLDKVRKVVDELESIVGNEYWPFPKYSELLFTH